MGLRKSPVRTPAFLAAHRRNAQMCIGPKTPTGKARSSLNRLKHGNYARRLAEKLRQAGYRDGAALYTTVYQEICRTFRPDSASEREQAVRWANRVFATAWRARIFGTKLECPLFSARLGPRCHSLFPIRILDPWTQTGLVFWVQRKGYWTLPKLLRTVFGPTQDRETRDSGLAIQRSGRRTAVPSLNPNPKPRTPLEQTGDFGERDQGPPLGVSLENRLRHRVFKMRQLTASERVKYGLVPRGGNGRIKGSDGAQARPESELEKLEAMIRAAKLSPHECY